MIETASIARPRFATPASVPDEVLSAAERVRSGRSSADAENRTLRVHEVPISEQIRRAEALRRARERVARYDSGR